MAQSGYTPIQLYHSTSAGVVPVAVNLSAGELAINTADGKLYYKDSSNVVQVIGWKTVPISAGGTGQTTANAALNALLPSQATNNGKVLATDGTNTSWADSVTSFSGGTTGLTPSTATTGVITLAGTLAIANGGTGQTTANAALNALLPSQSTNSGKFLTTNGTNTSWATVSGGTVTSVSFTGGIVSVATATTTPALTVAGTSGGIPYFSSASTWASSAALAANAIVIGGGAGVAPSTTTTGTGVLTALGNTTNTANGFVTGSGSVTLTNKTLTTPVLSGTASGTTSGGLGYSSGVLSFGDGTTQQTVMTLAQAQTVTAAKTFSANILASGSTVEIGSSTTRFNAVWAKNFVVDSDPTARATVFDAAIANVSYAGQLGLAGGGSTRMFLGNNFARPAVDNSTSFGDASFRWSAIWAANGTIQTSDQRQKTDIQDSSLGLSFINALRPVSYKWIVGGNEVTVVDDIHNPTITPRAGKRTHYGLLAQDVERVLDGKDFGGLVHHQEDDLYALRYDQFISPLIKAVQELSAKVTTLEAEVAALKAN